MPVGIIPVVVAGGIALKFTEAFLGKPKGQKRIGKTQRSKGKRGNNKNSPW